MTGRSRALSAVLLVLIATAGAVAWKQLPGIGAGALLHPARHHVALRPPDGCEDAQFAGDGVILKGWRCPARAATRGTIVYLHGSADNRASGTGVIDRFCPRGFEVIAYDSRAHGESGGEACTYGFYEKQDLRRVLDTIAAHPIVLIGASLGAAVALQETADDRRVTGVVAAETFSNLRTVATGRAPFFFTSSTIDRAFETAEQQARFRVDDVSPEAAAARITVPVLLVHGAADRDTPPEHSRRVFAALRGPKRLILVLNAPHNGSLRAEVWRKIETWILQLTSAVPPAEM